MRKFNPQVVADASLANGKANTILHVLGRADKEAWGVENGPAYGESVGWLAWNG